MFSLFDSPPTISELQNFIQYSTIFYYKIWCEGIFILCTNKTPDLYSFPNLVSKDFAKRTSRAREELVENSQITKESLHQVQFPLWSNVLLLPVHIVYISPLMPVGLHWKQYCRSCLQTWVPLSCFVQKVSLILLHSSGGHGNISGYSGCKREELEQYLCIFWCSVCGLFHQLFFFYILGS